MEQTNKRPLVILTGPTAVGKTAASIGLAKAIGGELISADSMQVYREMDIGSAKIRPEEMDGVPHHLVDVLDPSEDFNVVLFQQMAKEAMEGIYQRGHIPIVVGGTGFYIQALLYDIDFTENNADTAYREELEALAKTQGAEYLHEMLEKVDPESAEQIHFHNVGISSFSNFFRVFGCDCFLDIACLSCHYILDSQFFSVSQSVSFSIFIGIDGSSNIPVYSIAETDISVLIIRCTACCMTDKCTFIAIIFAALKPVKQTLSVFLIFLIVFFQ